MQHLTITMNVPRLDNKTIGLYLHIPYCRKKCPYCSFASTAGNLFPEREYTDCLKLELEKTLRNEDIDKDTRLESIYFGGGTPSLFTRSLIGELIDAARVRLTTGAETEITLELNPDSTTAEDLRELKGYGVNRLSIGLQSLNDRDLKTLGRLHTARQATKAFKDARELGFTNIGVDIISGIPRSSVSEFAETLDKVIELAPEHISVYGLTIEDETPFAKALDDGSLILPGEETERELFLMAVERLGAAGFEHYEISNFARPGRQSRHNTRYWSGGDYLGLGASAHSFIKGRAFKDAADQDFGRRWWNVKDAAEYIRLLKANSSPVSGEEGLTKQQAMAETIMLGLRQSKGIDERAFKMVFHDSVQEHLVRKDFLNEAQNRSGAKRLIYSCNGRLRLTKEGMLLSNEIY